RRSAGCARNSCCRGRDKPRPGRPPINAAGTEFCPIWAISYRRALADWGRPPAPITGADHLGALDLAFVCLCAAALFALSMAACAGTPETGQGPKENTGTLVGAVAGGLIGSQFGGGTGERIAAGLAGAALGGLIGNRIGAGMDDDDKRRAYAAQ